MCTVCPVLLGTQRNVGPPHRGLTVCGHVVERGMVLERSTGAWRGKALQRALKLEFEGKCEIVHWALWTARSLVWLEPCGSEMCVEVARVEAGQVGREIKGGTFFTFAYQVHVVKETEYLREKALLLDERWDTNAPFHFSLFLCFGFNKENTLTTHTHTLLLELAI